MANCTRPLSVFLLSESSCAVKKTIQFLQMTEEVERCQLFRVCLRYIYTDLLLSNPVNTEDIDIYRDVNQTLAAILT